MAFLVLIMELQICAQYSVSLRAELSISLHMSSLNIQDRN